MSTIDAALERLREQAAPRHPWLAGDVRFVALGGTLEQRWRRALDEISTCIGVGDESALSEGGVYKGAWVESTGTVSTDVLTRFAPEVARRTHLLFAANARGDGLMPYKVTAAGPAFSQIQIVTPLARSVWRHYLATGRDREYLRSMYDAMAGMDAWLASHRDTLGTGAVEAFCTFDTGHDLSPRFWGIPDRCHEGEAGRVDPANPLLPFVAPDLTANVACQRSYLALIADELGLESAPWRDGAAASERALWEQCFDAADETFYDRTATGEAVRVQSDVLLRVLACEIGDDAFMEAALRRYLLNSRKFFAGYGFTSIALDDPRFDRDFTRNSWAGPSNYLSALRAPDAFEAHHRVAELALSAMPLLAAAAAADRFPQCVDPWTGEPGFTEHYSPAILWFLDAIERHAGILPRPDGTVWLSALGPTRLGHGAAASATAYARTHAGVRYELAVDDARARVDRDGAPWLTMPRGWRVELDAAGDLAAVVGLAATPTAGELEVDGSVTTLTVAGNDRVEFARGAITAHRRIGVVIPRG